MSSNATLRITGSDETAAAWSKVIGSAQSAANQIQGIFAGAFAGLSIAGLASAVSQSLQLGEALKKAGAAAGVSGGTMSELAYVGRQAGVSMEELSTGLKKMQDAVNKAATGSQEEVLALKVLHLSAVDLLKLSPDAMFERIGAAIAALPDPTDRARAAIDLFGRAGTQLIPIFSEGGDAIEKARDQARELGLSLNDQTVDALAKAEAQVKGLDTALGNLWTTLVSKAAPGVGTFASGLVTDLGDDKLAKLNRELADLQKNIADIEAVGEKGAAPGASLIDRIRGRMFGPGGYNNQSGRVRDLQSQISLQGLALRPSDLSPVNVEGAAAAGAGASRFAGLAAADQAAEEARKALADFDKEVEKANTDVLDHMAKAGAAQASEDEKEIAKYGDSWAKARAEVASKAHDFDLQNQKSNQSLVDAVETFRGSMTTAFDDFLLKGQFTFKKLGEYMLESLATKVLNKELQDMFIGLETYLEKGSSGGTPGSGSGGGGLLSLISSAAGFFGFASGGSFDVVGSGGTDSQLVAFAATPGERVSVTPPGSDSGAGGHTFNMSWHVDARGADAERIMTIMPSLMNQASEKAKRDIIDAFRRGGYPAPRTA